MLSTQAGHSRKPADARKTSQSISSSDTNSDADKSDDDTRKTPSAGVTSEKKVRKPLGIELVPYTASPNEEIMWPQMDQHLDKTDLKTRLETIHKKCKKNEMRLYYESARKTFPGRSIRILEWGLEIQHDEGIIPDFLKILCDRDPDVSHDQKLQEFTLELADVTYKRIQPALDELGRFNFYYGALDPQDRYYYSLDKGATNQLPAVKKGDYWIVCAIPIAHIIRLDSYFSNEYLISRFPQVALMFEHNCLLVAIRDGFDGFVQGAKIFPFDPKKVPNPKNAPLLQEKKVATPKIVLKKPGSGIKRGLSKKDHDDDQDSVKSSESQPKRSKSETGGSDRIEKVSSRMSTSAPLIPHDAGRIKKLESRMVDSPSTSHDTKTKRTEKKSLPVAKLDDTGIMDISYENEGQQSLMMDQSQTEPASTTVHNIPSDDVEPETPAQRLKNWTIPKIKPPIPHRDKALVANVADVPNPPGSDAEETDSSVNSRPVSNVPLNFDVKVVENRDVEAEKEESLDIGTDTQMELDYDEETPTAMEVVKPNEPAAEIAPPKPRDPKLPKTSKSAQIVKDEKVPIYAVKFHRLHHELSNYANIIDSSKLKSALPPYFTPIETRPPCRADRNEIGILRIPNSYKTFLWYQMGNAQGLAPDIFDLWTPAATVDQLDVLIAKVVNTEERACLRPSEMMTVTDEQFPYFPTSKELTIDAIHKSGSQAYEHTLRPVQATLSAPSNLHNVTRHMGHQTTIFRGFYTGDIDDPRFLAIPTYRTLDSLAQFYLMFGSLSEQMAVRHYLFDQLKMYRDRGYQDDFFSRDTPSSRERASALWASLTIPPRDPIKNPLSMVRLMLIPYVARCHSTAYLMANPNYTTTNVDGGPANWNPPAEVITPMKDCEDLLTENLSTLRSAVTDLGTPYKDFMQPPLLVNMSQVEGEGTPAEMLNRSDRPDYVPHSMRGRQKYLNTMGEAVGNAYGALKLRLEKVIEWETFALPPTPYNRKSHVRSKRLQHDTVYIGGSMARELAQLSGSSYVGAEKLNIKEMLITVLMLNSPLWKKNMVRATYAIIVPDDSQLYMDEGLIEEPSMLHKTQKDQMLVGANIFAIHVAEVLRAIGIIPVFLEKLPRVQRDGNDAWKEVEFLQRASCWYYSEILHNIRYPWVSLQELYADCYNKEGYFGATEEHIKYSVGRDAEKIVELIDAKLHSNEVVDFWTPAGLHRLFYADLYKRQTLQPFEWFQEFLVCLTDSSLKHPEGEDVQIHVHWTGSLKHLKSAATTGTREEKAKWKLKLDWVMAFISNLSIHLDGKPFELPSGVTGEWAIRRSDLYLQNTDEGVKILDLTLDQRRTIQRGIESLWSAAYSTLNLSVHHPRDSHNQQKPERNFETLTWDLYPNEMKGPALSVAIDADRIMWYQIHPKSYDASLQPVPRMVTLPMQPQTTSDAELVGILTDWLVIQDDQDPVNNMNMTQDETQIKKALARWWIDNVGDIPSPAIVEFISRDAIRRVRRSEFYSHENQQTLMEHRNNPLYRGFFAAEPGVMKPSDIITPPQVPTSTISQVVQSGNLPSLLAVSTSTPNMPTPPSGCAYGYTPYPPAATGTSSSYDTQSYSPYAPRAGRSRSTKDITWNNQNLTIHSTRKYPNIPQTRLSSINRVSDVSSTTCPSPNFDKRLEELNLDIEKAKEKLQLGLPLNTPNPYGNPPSNVSLVSAPPVPEVAKMLDQPQIQPIQQADLVKPVPTEFDIIRQIVVDSGLDYTRVQIEEAIAGGKLLDYPLGRHVTNSKLLVYCEPPETALAMGDDYRLTLHSIVKTEMIVPVEEWNIPEVRFVVLKWVIRRKRHETEKMAIPRDVMSNILKKVEAFMTKLMPKRIEEIKADQSILCD